MKPGRLSEEKSLLLYTHKTTANRQTDRQTNKQTNIHTYTHTHTDRPSKDISHLKFIVKIQGKNAMCP